MLLTVSLILMNNYPIQNHYIQAMAKLNELYIFSSDFLLGLNFRTLKRLSLVHALTDILFTCSVNVHVLENVRPKSL